MTIKIVQSVAPITSAGAASTQSTSITLTTGQIRVAPVGAAIAVAIGTDPTATTSDFAVLENSPEVIKERVAKQVISGITTGSTTTITFAENAGNPFLVGDHVSIVGASPSGINTAHNQITGKTDSSITILLILLLLLDQSLVWLGHMLQGVLRLQHLVLVEPQLVYIFQK